MIYQYQCPICNTVFDIVQGMNDAHRAVHCGVDARRVWLPFQTDKDLMYQFDTTIFGNKPVNIYSRRQYKRLLKENGLVDETPRNCLTVKPPSEKDRRVKTKQFAEKMIKKVYDKGAMPYVRGEVNG